MAVEKLVSKLSRIVSLIAVAALRCYQYTLRPHLLGSCKFHPTCSEYAIDAIQKHGVIRGIVLAMWRLGRCHPFGPGGFDPVPQPPPASSQQPSPPG